MLADRDLKNILVTGGAGYIGSHACKALLRAGYIPVTLDSLVTGWRDAVKFGPLEQVDLLNVSALDEIFVRYKPAAVLHFAALSEVGESTLVPGRYWRNNVLGSLNLLEACQRHDCLDFIFSSTCATYGDQDGVLLSEDSPQDPINAYGASKRAIEDMLVNFSKAHGLRYVIFRYFNVAGADPEGVIGEYHRPETHLIPLIFEAIDGQRPALTIYGSDYPTRDGTCIRDYVHVTDLVDAHLRGLEYLKRGGVSTNFNLGTGCGFSVREVLEYAGLITNRPVPIIEGDRRPGDCASLVSGSTRAAEILGWEPRNSTLPQMIRDAWHWHQRGNYSA